MGALETVLALKFDNEESADVIEEVKGVAGGRMSDFVNETVPKLNCIIGE